MRQYRIRKAVIEDGKIINQIMTKAYSVYDKSLNLPPLFADYEKEVKEYPSWVLEVENKIIASLFMYFDQDAYINNIAVDPDYKGQGYGRILMDYAEKVALERDYHYLLLATHIKLSNNIIYYNKLGYEEIERDENKVYFRKKLI